VTLCLATPWLAAPWLVTLCLATPWLAAPWLVTLGLATSGLASAREWSPISGSGGA
jgi:hypothetical protein